MGLTIDEHMSAAEIDYVERRLVEFADLYTGPRQRRDFALALRSSAGAVCGGIIGDSLWDWLQIGTLWIAEEFRGQGFGRQLLARAEALGKERGCRFARLSTFEFEARAFYEAHGYVVFGQHDNFPSGHTQFYLAKTLA